MRHDDAGPARLLRPSERWRPIGPLLPPVEDDALHDDTLRAGQLVNWHFPGTLDAQPGDVLLTRERMVRLLGRCGPHHPRVIALRDYLRAHYEDADEWFAGRQVWSARVVDPTRR